MSQPTPTTPPGESMTPTSPLTVNLHKTADLLDKHPDLTSVEPFISTYTDKIAIEWLLALKVLALTNDEQRGLAKRIMVALGGQWSQGAPSFDNEIKFFQRTETFEFSVFVNAEAFNTQAAA